MHLICGTCGSDFEHEPSGASSVPCPTCGSAVPVTGQTLELDDGAADGSELDPRALPTALPELDTRDMTPSPLHEPSTLDFGDASVPPLEKRLPASRPPGARSGADAGRSAVAVSRGGGASWRDHLGWAVFITAVMTAASVVAYRRSLPPPPPQISNPLEDAVAQWQSRGLSPLPVRDAIAVGRTKLARSRQERLEGLLAVRRGLVTDPDSPELIALYARGLAALPSARDEETVSLALRGITAAVGEGPSSDNRAWLERARAWLLLEERRLDQARDAAARALDSAPLAPEARLVRAATRAELRPEEAAETLRELTGVPEVAEQARRWLAVSMLRSGQVHRAIALLEEGIASGAPNADELMRVLYDLRFSMGEERAARATLERLVESGNASAADRARLARELVHLDAAPERALEILDAGLAEDGLGRAPRARLYAEKVFVATGSKRYVSDPRELTAWVDRAVDLAPEAPEVLYARTLADRALDREERSLAGLEVANGLHPDIPEMAIDLAWQLRELDPTAAREVVDDALAATLSSIPLYLMSALLELDSGKPVRASQQLKRALAIDPERNIARARSRVLPAPVEIYAAVGDALLRLGRERRNVLTASGAAAAYFAAGDLRRASRALTQSLRLDRRAPPANLYAGILALRRNQRGSARAYLTTAWEEDRGLPLAQLYYARLLESGRDFQKAESTYREILHANPSATAAQIGLARVLWREGEKEAALAEARKVLAVRPDDREALVFMAEATAPNRPGRRRP